MIGFRRAFALFPCFVAVLSGCATLTQGTSLPEGFSVRELAKADDGAPFAVNRGGSYATVSKGATQLTDSRGTGGILVEGSAAALCFSPGGDKLAAAQATEDGTVLRLFDKRGKLLGVTTLPEMVAALSWRSEAELAVGTLAVTVLPSGSRLVERLYLWDGRSTPVGSTLREVTVRPQVAKSLQGAPFRSFQMTVSPYGDEIAYSSLVDPQLFPPYLRITVRNLETGREWEIGETSLGSGGPIYAPDGDSLLVGDEHALTRRLSIPDGREMDAWPAAGDYPAMSPSGAYTFLNGRLYQNGRSILSFPSRSRGIFLPDGSGLAVSYGGKLYLVSGLNDEAAPAAPANLERTLRLRKLRSLGLISEKEYRRQKRAK